MCCGQAAPEKVDQSLEFLSTLLARRHGARPPPSEAFGFTAGEVAALAALTGHADRLGELKDWCDGYDFGGEATYNPWSVLNYLRGCVARPCWANASSDEVARRLIGSSDEAANARLTASRAPGPSCGPRPSTPTSTWRSPGRDHDASHRLRELVWA